MKTYFAIDLKSFYASVECRERGLDPLETNLVVADSSRTSKTICLAITPPLKAYGLSGRSRLFEVEQKAKEIYIKTGKTLEYIVAPPRMSKYIEYSTRIYEIYLRFFCKEDIHVYSIDEVFIDATQYLPFYKLSARKLLQKVILEIFKETGITATGGIAPNLYLAKIAMDIEAKHMQEDETGCRIAELDEISYRKRLWNHTPITDFWRVGKGIATRLARNFMFTMGDIALCSLNNQPLLYSLFGIDAEILIDHAWGIETVGMKEIKGYRSKQKGIGNGQVLQEPYSMERGRIIVREMTENLVSELCEKGLRAKSVSLLVGYDVISTDFAQNLLHNEIVTDYYGRKIPKPSFGTVGFDCHTALCSKIVSSIIALYEKIVEPNYMIRRINVSVNDVIFSCHEEISLFDDTERIQKEESLQNTMLKIKKRFGKNSLLKGTNLQEGATMMERNQQIGGHKA